MLAPGAPPLVSASRAIQWIVAALVLLGIVMVFSTRAPAAARAHGLETTWAPLLDQAGKLAVALLFLAAGLLLRPEWLLAHARLVLAGAVLLLALVLVPGIGARINGARRWFELGPGFQPVELARVALIAFLAAQVEALGPRIREFWRGLVPQVAVLGTVMALLLAQPDFGSAVFFLGIGVLLLILGGARIGHFLLVALLGFPVCLLYALRSLAHVQARFERFFTADLGYQAEQSLLALGAGGVTGADLGAGSAKLGYLPAIDSDFILAAVGEELGFIGTSLVVLLFLLFTWFAIRIAIAQPTPGRFLLAAGLTLSIAMQAILNVAVVTAAVPTKGIALPFISAGGSSLALSLFAVGLLIRLAQVPAVGATSSEVRDG